MTLTELVQRAYQLATSKAIAPTAGNTKYDKIVGFANICTDQWQNESGVDWNSQYMKVTLPTTVTATDTIPLTASIRKVANSDSDFITITCPGGSIVKFTIVRPEELDPTENTVARVGSNLVFARTFKTTDPEYGGSVKVPCYKYASTLSNGSDEVEVDIPLWLAYMTAAEYCRTDMQLNFLEDGLVARASELMTEMKANNSGQFDTVRRAPLGMVSRSW